MLFKDFDGNYSEEDGGYIVAYASTFDRIPDLHGDVIAKGAFQESLTKWHMSGKPIPLIFNHQFDDPKYNIGHVTEAVEDDHGLRIKAVFDPDNEKAQYVRKLVQEGRMFKMSFGSLVQGAQQVKLDDGKRCREITKSEILEVSIVQIPANEHAEILEVKSGETADGGIVEEPILATPDRQGECYVLSKAYADLVIKALQEQSRQLILRLTDAQGNVVSEIPYTAEFIERELASVSDQQPDGAEVNSEETPEQPQEGDLSSSEASEDGETGAPAADEAFLAQFYQTIGQGE